MTLEHTAESYQAHSKRSCWAVCCCCWVLLFWHCFCRGHHWPQFILHPLHPHGFSPVSSPLYPLWIYFLCLFLKCEWLRHINNIALHAVSKTETSESTFISLFISLFHSVSNICLWDLSSMLRFRASSVIRPLLWFRPLPHLGCADNLSLIRVLLSSHHPAILLSICPSEVQMLVPHAPWFKPLQFLIIWQIKARLSTVLPSLTHHSNLPLQSPVPSDVRFSVLLAFAHSFCSHAQYLPLTLDGYGRHGTGILGALPGPWHVGTRNVETGVRYY